MLKPSVLVACLVVVSATAADLQRVDLPIYHAAQEVTLDIGDLIDCGQVQPRSAITVDRQTSSGWLLSTDKGESWSAPIRPIDWNGTDGGYPSSVQRKGGQIVTGYYPTHRSSPIW